MGRGSKRKNRRRCSGSDLALPRGCRGNRRKRMRNAPIHDLNVPIPRSQSILTDVIGRLRSTGYGVVAFSHTIYGRPDPKKDTSEKVLEDSAIENVLLAGKDNGNDDDARSGGNSTTTILRRLNAVVEELSDIAYFTDSADLGGETGKLLDSYDIIAVSPRSDATFSSACSTANRADIIMLDYTTGRLPFKLKTSAVCAASQLGIAFEMCYASAVLDPAKRKILVRIAIDLQNACRGVRSPEPRIILSSGTRVASGNDFGSLALRTPGDLVNVLSTVLKFSVDVAAEAMGISAEETVKKCRNRGLGVCPSATSAMANTTVGVDTSAHAEPAMAAVPAIGSMNASIQKQLATSAKMSAEKEESPVKEKLTTLGEGSWISHIDSGSLGKEETSDNDCDSDADGGDDHGFINLS